MTTKRKSRSALALASGGKDSILAIHLATSNGFDIKGIVTVIPEDPESMLYHTHNVFHVEEIARSIGAKWYPVEAPESEEEESLSTALTSLDATTLVTGGIASKYQKIRFERIGRKAGMDVHSPIWNMNQEEVLERIVKMGFDTIIISVAAYGLGEEWLGRHLDYVNVNKLLSLSQSCQFNIVGEGGEYDTLVLDAPFYTKRLEPTKVLRHWYGDRGRLEIVEMSSIDKGVKIDA